MHSWIVGGGLAAAATSYELRQHRFPSYIFEKEKEWGGLVRSSRMEGVIYEPHGSHILHTDDQEVWELLTGLVPFNDYEHRVQTMVRGELLTWPIQEDEIRRVYGDDVARRTAEFSAAPNPLDSFTGMDFETWCLSIMDRAVYDDFVAPYTEKQWGRHPSKLSADFAPKRVQVRTDGDTRLFKDKFQGFPDGAQDATWEDVLRELFGPSLHGSYLHTEMRMTLNVMVAMLESYPDAWRPDYVVITAPLDDFAHNALGKLDWRGLIFDHKHLTVSSGFAQERMVVNWPGAAFPWIRTHETKHASRQRIVGTVLTTEFPGGPARYYPVPGKDGKMRARNLAYQQLIRDKIEALGPRCLFVGRLANFKYQDVDEIVRDALDIVRKAMGATVGTAA